MQKLDVDRMIDNVRKQFEALGKEVSEGRLAGLRRALLHPKAGEQIFATIKAEKTCPQPGEPAPDFSLPRLDGGPDAAPVRLSDHFGKRPVALIFGSYT